MELQQEQLLQASAELLDRVYTACQGLSLLTCPTAAMFATTYHEVHAQRFTAWLRACTINTCITSKKLLSTHPPNSRQHLDLCYE